MFFKPKKDEFDKINDLTENGKLGRLCKIATNNQDYRIRRAAYRGIGKLRSDASTEFLFSCFEKKVETEPKVIIAMAQSLGKLANKNDFEKIQQIAQDYEDKEVYDAIMAASVEAKGRSPRNLIVR